MRARRAFPASAASLDGDHAEAKAGLPRFGLDPAAVRGPAFHVEILVAPPANDTLAQRHFWSQRVLLRADCVVVYIVPVLAPLPNIPMHLV